MSYLRKGLGLTAWYENESDPFLLAKGSLFGETESSIGIYRFDPLNTQNPFQTMGSFETGVSFNCITWTDGLADANKGVLTAGLSDGSLLLVDAETLIDDYRENRKTGENCVKTSFELYETGEFYCLEYNAFKPTLLATGGKELYIVNFDRSLEEPDIFCPGAGEGIITSLSWNKTKGVQHILATSRDNGKIDIFDFKLKKSIFSFGDGKESQTGREVNLAWSANIPTQLAVAFDDNESGVQIWDLRNNKAPVKILDQEIIGRAHSLDWSQKQRGLVLCADKEGSFVEYDSINNVYTPYPKEDNFQTLYAKFIPTFEDAFFAVSFNGHLKVQTQSTDNVRELALKNVPFWLESDKSCGVDRFGKGVVSINNNDSTSFIAFETKKKEDREKTELETKMEEAQDNISSSNRDSEQLTQKLLSDSQYDAYILKLIEQTELEESEKLNALDINLDLYLKNTEKLTGYSYSTKPDVVEERKSGKIFAEITEDDALDFFTGLAQGNEKKETEEQNTETQGINNNIYEEPSSEDIEKVSINFNNNWKKGLESYITKNIVINNYEGAIDCAIKANRIFEAFMIAYAHPYDREKYFEYLIERFSIENKNSFLQNFLNPLTHKDYSSIIDSYDTNEWKDILTFIVKNIESKHEREGYYQKLIDKLNKESDKRSAVLYINLFCNNFDSFINILLEENSNNNTDYTLLLKNFQLLYLLKLKNKLEIRNNTLQQQLLKLCNALIDKQFVRLAYELLEVLGDSKDDRINLYQNELYRAYSAELNLFYAQPAALKLFNFNFPKAKTAPVKSDKNKFGPKKTNPFNPTKPGIKRTSDRKPVNIFGNKPTINKPLVKNPGDTKKRKVIAPPKPKLQQKEQPLSPPIPAKPTFKPGFQKNPITTMTAKPMPPKTTKFAPKPPAPVNPHNSFKPQESNPLGIQNPKTPMVKPPPPTIKKPMIQNKVVKPVKPPVKKMAPAPPTNPLPQTMQSTMPPKPSTIRTGVKPALSKPPQKKVAPPPPMQKKTPNPMPREVFVPDQAMVEEINGFIAKTPDFISSIEPDHFKANQMKTSLNQLNSMISNGSIDENTFNEIYEVVNSISENDMNRANAILKSLSLKANSKLKPVIGTFQAFVDALS